MVKHGDKVNPPSSWRISVGHQVEYYRTADEYLKVSGQDDASEKGKVRG